MKWRNSKERELLASGGSRDQTLPNKNNPNPDLSDARGDRQPSLSPTSSPSLESPQQPQSQQTSPQGSAADRAPKQVVNANGQLLKQKPLDLKYEFDEGRTTANGAPSAQQQPPQMIFSNGFYNERERRNSEMSGQPGSYSNSGTRSNGSAENNMTLYYDEYDSNSDDSDEEINVT